MEHAKLSSARPTTSPLLLTTLPCPAPVPPRPTGLQRLGMGLTDTQVSVVLASAEGAGVLGPPV